MNVRSNMLLFFFLYFFFSVCMYDLAYIMRNHVLFLLFFFSYIREVYCKGSNAQHTCKCLCACTSMCVCLFVCVHCCVYVWVERRSLHHSQTLSPFVVGSAKPMLRCTVLSTTARTLGARLLTKADCSATAQRTAA